MKALLVVLCLFIPTAAFAWQDDDDGWGEIGNPALRHQDNSYTQYNYQPPPMGIGGRECIQWNCIQAGPTRQCMCSAYR